MPGSGGRPKKGVLMRKMGPSRWGKMDRPKLGDQQRGPARPVLTAGELERPLLLVLQ